MAGLDRIVEKRDLEYIEAERAELSPNIAHASEECENHIRSTDDEFPMLWLKIETEIPYVFPVMIGSDKIPNIQISIDILQYLHGNDMGIQLHLLQMQRS